MGRFRGMALRAVFLRLEFPQFYRCSSSARLFLHVVVFGAVVLAALNTRGDSTSLVMLFLPVVASGADELCGNSRITFRCDV